MKVGAVLRHEWRLLRRLALVALAVWATAVLGAVLLGQARAGRHAASAERFVRVDEGQIEHYRRRAEAIERVRAGKDQGSVRLHPDEFEWGPTQPLYVAAWVPMKTVVPPAPLAALAVGEAEIRPLAYRVSLFNGELVPVVEPATNPLAVSLGRFDLTVAVVLLVPVLAIALGFDLSARERDAGILPLALSQPVSPRALLAAKLAVRALALLFCLGLATGAAALLTPPSADGSARLLAWFLTASAYAGSWLALCAAVDSLGRPATWNALVLAGAWLVSTSVMPAAIQAAASGLSPVPARAEWAEERRSFEAARDKAFDALRDDEKRELVEHFRREQPAYGEARPAADTIGYYYLSWAAHVAAWEPRRLALEGRPSEALAAQERLVDRLRYLSPSALALGALLDITGAGRGRFEHFQAEAARYDARYKQFLWPRMFANATLRSSEFPDIPRFTMREEAASTALRRAFAPGLGLFVIASLLLGFAFIRPMPSPS
jgi:ABC-2 type transport system permease protein